jgi:hypothetical protein
MSNLNAWSLMLDFGLLIHGWSNNGALYFE